jgi:hypothetical protein
VTTTEPVLPYGGTTMARTSGHSGSDTSAERAEREDANGTTRQRQARVLALLVTRGQRGATWQEVAAGLGLHHGQASGPLSNLHKAGRIERLAERRNRCAVYVLPEHVAGRETSAYTPNSGRAVEVTSPAPTLPPAVLEALERVRAFVNGRSQVRQHSGDTVATVHVPGEGLVRLDAGDLAVVVDGVAAALRP